MVVDFRPMSNVNFAIPDFRPESLNPDTCAHGYSAQQGEPARLMALASGAGGMQIVSGTFSVSHRPVGQLIFARRLARTYAVSGPATYPCFWDMWGGFQLTIDGSLSSSGGAAKPALSLSKGAVRRGRQPALDEPSPSAAERRTLLYRPLRITARLGVRVRYGLITTAIAEQPNSGLSGILPKWARGTAEFHTTKFFTRLDEGNEGVSHHLGCC